jgi:hypothetical protein
MRVTSFIGATTVDGAIETGYTWATTKKADAAGRPQVSDHVGLLANEPTGEPGCSLSSHPTTIIRVDSGAAFIVNASPLTALSYRPHP